MTDSITETYQVYCPERQRFRVPSWVLAFMGVILFVLFSAKVAHAQEETEFDELAVFLQVQNMGVVEIQSLIRGQEVLLPVSDLFTFLKIKSSLSTSMDTVSGFFLSPEFPYKIDRSQNLIVYRGKSFQLKSGDLIRTETNLYLLSKYFGEIFGLDCKFNQRALSVVITTKIELPAVREMRLAEMRQNINQLKGETKVDTIIRRTRSAFHFGMADWSAISTQQFGGIVDTRLNLALGSVIAGGEANLLLNYDTNEPFREKQQNYYWKFVNNGNSFLRQTTLGKIGTEAISSIYNPVVGIKLTNTPSTFRRSFGTYPLSDYTNPGWMVELYVNNVLVDYKKADASGFFSFQVPLVYGNSKVNLKFYGPWGEEKFKEQQITVPFSFLPTGELEYTYSAGMIEDGKQSIFSRGEIRYGLTRGITMGSGVEYLSTISNGSIMPFLTVVSRPLSNLLLSGEYTYGVRGKGIISLQLPKNIQAELNYIKYKPGQTAVNYNYLEERKAILTLPLRGKNYSFYNRMTFDQIILPGTGYSTLEWLISGATHGISTNLTNYAMFTGNSKPYIYSNLSFSLRLPSGITFIPQAQYEYTRGELISFKGGFEKYLFRNGFIALSYENNFKSKVQSAQFGIRFDLPFAQAGYTSRLTNNQLSMIETARGSLIFDRKNKYYGATNRSSVGKGGIVFSPFLDINCNNKRDNGEPKADKLNIRINGGNSMLNDRDTTIRVSDLEPYTSYLVELDANSFDNVAWKIRNKTFKIVVDPNSFKLVEIPVQVVGEVAGMIMKEKNGNQEGLGRVIVNIYNTKSQPAGKILSEPDGYYSYMGLAPGVYEVKVDTAQLRRLHLISLPEKQTITINGSSEGDIVDGIDFTLRSTLPEVIDTTNVVSNAVSIPIQAENQPAPTPPPVVAPLVSPPVPAGSKEQTYLQVGAFKGVRNAEKTVNAITSQLKYPAKVVQENGWYKVWVGGFATSKEAELCKTALVANGIIAANQIREIHTGNGENNPLKPEGSTKQPVPATNAPAGQTTKEVTTQQTETVSGTQNLVKQDNILKRHYYVQVGAFKNPKNATKLIKYVSKVIPYPVGSVYREQFYKVRFGPFETQSEMNDCIRKVVMAGIMTKELLKIDYEEIGSTPAADQPHLNDGFHVQVGAFNIKENAVRYFKLMSESYPYPILMIEEDGYYKVRFGPFKNVSDTKKCRKVLVKDNVDCFMRSNTVKYF